MARWRADRDLLVAAVRAAAPRAMADFRLGSKTTAAIETKGPPGRSSRVTSADLAVNDALREALRTARPDYGWLSEEDRDDPAARMAADAAFSVDPIDGTDAFIKGDASFCLSVAIVSGGAPVAAAIFAPAADALYAASLGGGATLNGARLPRLTDGEAGRPFAGPPILCGAHRKSNAALARALEAAGAELGALSPLATGLAAVAEAKFGALARARPVHEWDVAAGALLASEVGADVTDAEGAPVRFNSAAEPRLASLVAAPPLRAAAIRKVLAKLA